MNQSRESVIPALWSYLYLIIVLLIMGCSLGKSESRKSRNVDQGTTQELLAGADSIFRTGQYLQSREIYEKALGKAEKAGNNSDMTEAQSMIARTYLILDDKEAGNIWIALAEKIANRDEPLGWSRFLGVKGRFVWQDDNLEKATEIFKEMYHYCHENSLYERAIDAAHMVAITGDYPTQIEWGKKGIEEARAGKIHSWLGPLWNNLGATYEDGQQYDSALSAYLEAKKYHDRHGTESNKMIANWAVGHAYRLLEDYNEALKWLRPIVLQSERLKNGEFRGLTLQELGEIDFSQNKFESAHKRFVKAETLLKEAGMDSWDKKGYQKLLDRIEETSRGD